MVHLIVSRSATGSSARFAAAFACAYLCAAGPLSKPLNPSGSYDRLAQLIGQASNLGQHKRMRLDGAPRSPADGVRPVTARFAVLLEL